MNKTAKQADGNTGRHLLLCVHPELSYEIVEDRGWYDGTKPELNVRAVGRLHKLDHLTPHGKPAGIDALIDEIRENSEDVGMPRISGCLYSITQDQERALIEANEEQEKADRIDKIQGEIDFLRRTIDKYAGAKNPPKTIAESRMMTREYNDAYNEGGYGFVPHFASQEEADRCSERIAQLEAELNSIIGE